MGFLAWVKRLFCIQQKESKIPTIQEIHKADNYETVEYHPNPKVEEQSQKLEQLIKSEYLAQPQTKRLTHSHSYQPPAEQHRDAISKFMKGKASSRYLRTIKQSPKIKIEEDN